MKQTRIAIFFLLAAVASLPAAADTLRYTGPAYGSYTSGGFNLQDANPSSYNRTVNAGGFSMLNLTAGGSFVAWCVDIYHNLDTSNAGDPYTLTPGATFYPNGSAYKQTDLERLATHVLGGGLLTGNVTSAAFQLAIWEIVNEVNTAQPYSIGTNDFRVTSGNSSARETANQWLSAVNNWGSAASNYSLSVWSGGDSTQDLAVFTVTPVPEPETYAMLLAGLGLMGFVVRRRRAVSTRSV